MPSCHESGAEDQPRDLRRLRAERQAQAELLRALRDRIGRDRVDADRREHQRDDGQDDEDRSEDAVRPARLGDRLVERPDVEERLILIERLRGFADGRDHRRGIGHGAHQHGRAQRRAHARGSIERRPPVRAPAPLPDGSSGSRRRSSATARLILFRSLHEADPPAQRVLARPGARSRAAG